jgi:hypothetical protein
MERRFDKLAKMLAGDVSRRTSFGWIAAASVGALLGPPFVRKAAAACTPGPTCPANSCPKGPNCFCSKTSTGRKPFCFKDVFCSGLMTCLTNAQCKSAKGKGWKCVATCCFGGVHVCVPKCTLVTASAEDLQEGPRASGH